jgi:hypothetical protein
VSAVQSRSCPLLRGLFHLTSRRVDGQRRELTVGTLCVSVRVLRVLRVRISALPFFPLPPAPLHPSQPPTRVPEQNRKAGQDEVLWAFLINPTKARKARQAYLE